MDAFSHSGAYLARPHSILSRAFKASNESQSSFSLTKMTQFLCIFFEGPCQRIPNLSSRTIDLKVSSALRDHSWVQPLVHAMWSSFGGKSLPELGRAARGFLEGPAMLQTSPTQKGKGRKFYLLVLVPRG